MEEKNITIVEGLDGLPPPAYSVVAVAISGSRKTKHVISWALDKFVQEGSIYFKLLHVRPVVSRIPTPMGNFIPISQVRDDVAAAFRKELEWQTSEKLLPYRKMCSQRKVQVEIVQIESDDVVTAISGAIHKHKISKIVIGASSRSIFSRARTLSSKISEYCPTFCTVYAVSKGKLSSLRPSDSETNQSFRDDSSDTSSIDNSSSNTSSSQTDWTGQGSFSRFRSASLPMQRFQALSTINQTLLHKRMPSNGVMLPKNLGLDAETSDGTNSCPSGLDVNEKTGHASSFTSSVGENTSLDLVTTSETSNKDQVNFELEKLRIELRHIRGMYAMAQSESIDASRKLNELQKRHLEEEINLKQISLKEEEAKELARQEKKRYQDAKREAELVKDCAKREAVERKEVEIRVSRQSKEKENLESILNGHFYQYRQFTWEEIISATSSFSENLKIGMGSYGTVYKGSFQHTIAAVKVLHAKEGSRVKQFQQELEILSKIRHPHLLILLGACPDRSCLVYEFMENGSLEDRLYRINNTPPLLWFDRVRIAWEIASALVFLHNSKPKAIIHRDLKPANILLDRNYVSKIGDVGLSKMVSEDSLLLSTAYKDTAPVGTLCYIDPEYQRTGVVSPKSDVYAFGIVVLQLLTAKQAIALAHKVENAVGDDRLMEILDSESAGWPIEESKGLALIALKCTELRQRDRPDLQHEVLPALEKLKDVADRARSMALVSAPAPPKHFACPILREVMTDPCVAADGYTYDRKAIEAWLHEKDTSPITELPLPHRYLIPNYALLSAIMEWKSGK
ncbi:U-box domain-containing protein kinase family protein [Perilla frutescens var. hirtella]|uniref:RING-type E3 ubiquitin transferase n=1 Tax=Perilla frutescens var. hirtella TaxID=608512 RepID=A0AAD4ITG7_PERFH|nr:U-box domain-containing protein kinase family protein [Perilla frutescens var. hirtella]